MTSKKQNDHSLYSVSINLSPEDITKKRLQEIHYSLRENSEQRYAKYLDVNNCMIWQTKMKKKYIYSSILLVIMGLVIIAVALYFINEIVPKLGIIFIGLIVVLQYAFCIFKKQGKIIFDFKTKVISIIANNNGIRYVPFERVIAIQNVANYFPDPYNTMPNRPKPTNHQLNLVLDDYSRIRVIDHDSRAEISLTAEKLSVALCKSYWKEPSGYDENNLRRNIFVGYIVLGGFVLFGLFGMIFLSDFMAEAMLMEKWSSVSARIEAISEDAIVYSYDFQGKEYKSSKIGKIPPIFVNQTKISRGKNRVLTCYVNPADPTDAVLARTLSISFYVAFCFLLLFFTAGVYGIIVYHQEIKDEFKYQKEIGVI